MLQRVRSFEFYKPRMVKLTQNLTVKLLGPFTRLIYSIFTDNLSVDSGIIDFYGYDYINSTKPPLVQNISLCDLV